MNFVKSSVFLFAGFMVASTAEGLELELDAESGCFPLCNWEDHAKPNIRFGSYASASEIPTLQEVTEAKLRHGGLHGGLWPEFKYRSQWEPFVPGPIRKCEGMGCLTDLLHEHRAAAGSR